MGLEAVSPRMRRRRVLALALLLALGAVLWMFLRSEADSSSPLHGDPAGAARLDPRPLEVSPGDEPFVGEQPAGPPKFPALAGHATPSRAQAERGPVRVLVTGAARTPLPGVYLRARGAPERTSDDGVIRTDDRGLARFADLPYDGSVSVEFFRDKPEVRPGQFAWNPLDPLGGGDNKRVVTGRDVTYRAQTGVLMLVRLVAAETGSDVAGAQVRCVRSPAASKVWESAPRRFLIAPRIGRRWVVSFEAQPPAGWVAFERTWLSAVLSPYAREVEFVYPLRREVQVSVTPMEEEGGTARAEIQSLSVAGRTPADWSWKGDASGRLNVYGVPFLRNEVLELSVRRPDGTGFTKVRTVLPDHPAARLDLRVVLPKEDGLEGPSDNGAIGIGGGSSSSFSGPRHAQLDNAVLITVRRHNGLPAVNAPVTLGRLSGQRTDAKGQVRFERVQAGAQRVTVRQAGLLPLTRSVDVREKGTTRVDLREGSGGIIDLLVVDEQGRPLSYAAVRVKTPSGLAWVDLQGKRQRIDPFTDHLGHRRLTHVETGDLELTASWGSRRVSIGVDVKEGETSSLRVILPAPRQGR